MGVRCEMILLHTIIVNKRSFLKRLLTEPHTNMQAQLAVVYNLPMRDLYSYTLSCTARGYNHFFEVPPEDHESFMRINDDLKRFGSTVREKPRTTAVPIVSVVIADVGNLSTLSDTKEESHPTYVHSDVKVDDNYDDESDDLECADEDCPCGEVLCPRRRYECNYCKRVGSLAELVKASNKE